MGPDEVGAALVAALGSDAAGSPETAAGSDTVVSVSGGGRWARATVDVPPDRWVDALTAARDQLGCDFFDWLTAVDEQERGYAIVAHVWSTAARHGVLVRTTVEREAPAVATAVSVYPGAAWHERETHEMFGVDFPGHPDLAPLLLPPEFDGHPLRKDFVLAARVAKAWPGAKEPGESDMDGPPKRAPLRPPGVPAAGEWGPRDKGPASAG
jgi:NADH-quinone oxidoreductase subunit C